VKSHTNLTMRTFDPDTLDLRTNYHLMISGIIPRPIALVTTVDKMGKVNLAPFSFYNGFGSNPPIVGFSPAFSGRTGKAKDTLLNIQETKEFTISMVSTPMMDKMVITSKEFERGIDEYVESGFSKRDSEVVRPPGVMESPYILECKLQDIIELGGKPGSGNLILGQIVRFHVSELAFDNEDRISPYKLDAIGRLGLSWYSRVKSGIFEVDQKQRLGFENLPGFILNSSVLTGSHLNKLASIIELPETDQEFMKSIYGQLENELHTLCRKYIDENEMTKAWQVVYVLREMHE